MSDESMNSSQLLSHSLKPRLFTAEAAIVNQPILIFTKRRQNVPLNAIRVDPNDDLRFFSRLKTFGFSANTNDVTIFCGIDNYSPTAFVSILSQKKPESENLRGTIIQIKI